MTPVDPDQFRAESREAWERNAADWGRNADRQHEWAVEVSATMVDALAPQPGDRVLELAAGPGDTGFMAAELIEPGGTLICSDGAQAMLEVARERAAAQRIRNVEFRVLDLEWIDMETASVDAVLCRWGLMLVIDPGAAAREIRRVLRPGGRAALAVWDAPERNPWTTIPMAALRAQPGVPAPDPESPGMFSLAADGALSELLENAGFVDVRIGTVTLVRRVASAEEWLQETLSISPVRRELFAGLDAAAQSDVRARIAEQAASFTDEDGSLVLPGSSLVASASA
ncbi:MAG TPA: methyltransferase domain-containing protein [Solirubrobacteraceae bacterium]|nr:methyltransferase domain-containing protein [Solirubrobacteraceae bacterium]